VSLLRKPKPAAPPTVSSDGVEMRVGVPLTLDHPHCVIATIDFWSSFGSFPDGSVAAMPTQVRRGQLADDRGPLVKHYPKNFRRPDDPDAAA
jgi:hypothetical protein